MHQPHFSVIIPAYNRAKFIADTLTSVRNQDFKDFEILVVDDGSTDETSREVERLGARVIRQKNSGPGVARNTGVAAAKGKYLAFLDSDDRWFPWTLKFYAKVIAENHEPAFVTGKPIIFSNENELDAIEVSQAKTEVFDDYFRAYDQWRWFGVSSFVIRRDCFLDAGGFADGRINGEDAELAMRLGTAKGFVHLVEPLMFAYLQHDGNVTLDTNKSQLGLDLLLRQESQCRFPGGTQRERERWSIISRHVRPFAIERARAGDFSTAMRYYFSLMGDTLRNRRLRFLSGLPVIAVIGWFRSLRGNRVRS